MNRGGRNLIILGCIAATIALATTSVSLAIYHGSGDIYLDRSRPGYLPDKEEIEQADPVADEYEFDKSGPLTSGNLEEYLDKLQQEIDAINAYEKPFSADALSDDKLGI